MSYPQPPCPTPQLTRVWRVAKALDVSRKRIYQMVREGKIEAVRLGPRSMRITVASVQAFIKDPKANALFAQGLGLPPK